MLTRGGGRRGFTLVEVIVVIVIGMVLAAAIVPALIGTLDRSRIDESAHSLEGIVEAIGNMHDDVARYPGALSHLSAPISAVDSDVCGSLYGTDALRWAGPYLTRSIPSTGLPLPIGVASNALGYSGSPPLLTISVNSVDEVDARALNRRVDDDGDSAAGAVRWGAVDAEGLVVLSYVRPVRSC